MNSIGFDIPKKYFVAEYRTCCLIEVKKTIFSLKIRNYPNKNKMYNYR